MRDPTQPVTSHLAIERALRKGGPAFLCHDGASPPFTFLDLTRSCDWFAFVSWCSTSTSTYRLHLPVARARSFRSCWSSRTRPRARVPCRAVLPVVLRNDYFVPVSGAPPTRHPSVAPNESITKTSYPLQQTSTPETARGFCTTAHGLCR